MKSGYTISTGRKGEVDFVKGFAILSVVIGHLVTFEGLVFKWIFGFHMPVFFLLYGYMLKERCFPLPKFVIKQARRLLVPTWIYRLLYCAVILMLVEKTQLSGSSVLFSVFWDAALEWFLPVMFWVSVGMYFYLQLYRKVGNDKLFAFCYLCCGYHILRRDIQTWISRYEASSVSA